MRRLLLITAFTMILVGATAVALGAYAWHELQRPGPPPAAGFTITVGPGASFRSIAAQLQRAGVLRHALLLTAWARYRGLDRSVRRGEYRITQALSPLELLALLQSASEAVQRLTMPEGFTVAQLATLVEQKGFAGRDVFLGATRDAGLLLDLDVPASGLEGYLFPDTYAFTWETAPEAIIRAMLARFRQQSAELNVRRLASGLSEEQMVILASIIEKETGRAEERPMISGVFHNRLRIGMPLQTDPTVIYGLPDFDGNLHHQDLANPSPYNTYVHRGLPPGPIANPGRAALEAAVDPASTDALYFVSRNDGSHEFSASLAAHNRAVRKFQKRSRTRPSRTAN